MIDHTTIEGPADEDGGVRNYLNTPPVNILQAVVAGPGEQVEIRPEEYPHTYQARLCPAEAGPIVYLIVSLGQPTSGSVSIYISAVTTAGERNELDTVRMHVGFDGFNDFGHESPINKWMRNTYSSAADNSIWGRRRLDLQANQDYPYDLTAVQQVLDDGVAMARRLIENLLAQQEGRS